jgi:hypothetical protein
MSDKKYTYKGKEYSYSDLQSKYGDKADTAIKKFGFKEVASEPSYLYNGKEYSHSELKQKYGDNTDKAIAKFGFEQVGKKKDNSNSTVPQKGSESNSEVTSLGYGKRNDGTQKGKGFFGELKMKDGSIATEISIGVNLDGKEREIPTLVPTLTPKEKEWLLQGNDPNDRSKIGDIIANKAIDHARKRISEGKSPFNEPVSYKNAKEVTSSDTSRKLINKSNPEVSKLNDDLQATYAVSDTRKQEITQKVDAEINQEGIWNNIKYYGKKALNAGMDYLGQATGMAYLFGDGEVSKDLKFQTNPLENELKEVNKQIKQDIAVAKKENKPIPTFTEKEKISKARDLKIQKEIKSESDSQVRSFIKEAEKKVDASGISDKEKLKLFQTNELDSLSEKDRNILKKKDFLEFLVDNNIKEINEVKNNKYLTPVDRYTKLSELYNKHKSNVLNLKESYEDYVSNQENIGNVKDNIDVLKRNYGWLKNFVYNAGATGLDLTAGGLSFLDWLDTSPTNYRAYTNDSPLRKASSFLRDTAEDVRSNIAKPISIEDVNFDSPNFLPDFGQWFWNTAVANQVPIYATIATGAGGIASLGASATGTKYEDMLQDQEKEGVVYSDMQKTLVPIGYGASETISATVDRMVMMNAKRVFQSATLPERKMISGGMWQGVKEFSKEFGKGTLDVAKNTAYEGIDEAGTEIMQNLMDIHALGKKDVGVFDNVFDATAAGMSIGFIMSGSSNAFSINKALKNYTVDNNISKANKEILRLEKALDNPNLSVLEQTTIESQLNKAKVKSQSLLEKVTNNISSLSNEEFDALKRIERTQANLKEQAKEIQQGELEQSLKDQIVSNLKEEFDSVESQRLGILKQDANTILGLLPQSEILRLKDEASKELLQEQDPEGNKTINLEDAEISQRALENYRKEENEKKALKTNEAAQKEDIVSDGNIQPGNDKLDSVQTELENQQQGNNEVQNVQPTETVERPQVIKTSDKGKEYTVFKEDNRVVFKDKYDNSPSENTYRKLSLEYAKKTDLTEGSRAYEVVNAQDSSELSNMTIKETNKFIADNSQSPVEVAETILSNEIENYRNDLDYKGSIIAEHIGYVSRQSFIDNSDAVHAIEGGSIPIQYLRKDGAPLDTKAKELSEIAGIEITEQDLVDFILDNPTGPQTYLNNGFHQDINSLKAKFEELTGLQPTNEILQEVVNQNDNKSKKLENATSLDFMSDEELLHLHNQREQYEKETTNRSTEGFSEISNSGNNAEKSRIQQDGSESNQGIERERGEFEEGRRVNLSKDTFNKLVQTFQKFFGAGNVHSDSNKLAKVLGQDPNSVFFQKQWEGINNTFNNELEQLEKGTLPKGHIFKLGNPTKILQAAGIPNLPIELAASRLKDKSKQDNHPFDLSDIKDLAIAVQNPLAVFDSSTQLGSFVVLTELTRNGKNFIAAIEANKKKNLIEINDIRSVYPRNNMQIISAINDNLTRYADKQKMREWFSKQRFNSAEVKGLFSRASNIVQKFENPTVNDVDFQVDYKRLASDNKYTQPKVPSQNIFLNDVEVLSRETESIVGQLVDEGKNVSVQSVDVSNIIPTQKNVNINNLKEVQDVRERPLLFKQGNKYYVIDGHHRISNEILEGEKKVEADVYDIDTQFMQTPDGTIWGATYLNEQGQREIYINESSLSPETLLHEVYHPFDDIMKKASLEGDDHAISAISRLDTLANENGYLKKVQDNPNYANKSLEQQQSEARVQMIGEIGNKQLDSSFYEKLEAAVVDAIRWLTDKLGISLKDYTPDQILNLKLEDIVKGSLASANKGDFEKKKGIDQRQNADYSPSANVQNRFDASPSDANIINLSKDLQLDKFIENLDKAIDKLDQFGQENLGMNLPLVVARQGLMAMKVAAKTAKSVADIISAGLNAVQKTEWYKNLSKEEQADLDSNFIDYLNKPYETNKNTRGRDKVEKEIQDSLKEGKTEQEIIEYYSDRMEKMMATDYFNRLKEVDSVQAKKQVDEAFDKADKKMEELTNPKFSFDKLLEKFNIMFLDRQWKPKYLLNKAGGRIVRNYIITSKGANGYAKYLYEKAYDQIYKGLSSDQIKVLDKVIQLRRFIAIDENRRNNNLPAVVHPDYINENVAKSYLDSLKQELGDRTYNDLLKRADVYFDTFKGLLNEMQESGIISKESRDRFFDVDYQPREFLEFLNDKDLETNSLDNVNIGGLGQDQIQKLEKGLDTALITDSQYLLSRALNVRAKSIAMNRVNERFVYFMNEQAEKVSELKKKNKLTPKEKKLINDFKMLSKHVKLNPIVGYTESGNPIYRHKKTPNGFSNAYYWIDGVKQNILMENGFHEQYFDSLKFLFKDGKSKEKVTLASGTALVKSIATGNNPAFFIVNSPRDFLNILAFSEEYSLNVPLSALRLVKDTGKGILDIKNNTITFENFVKYGGMTDFLMNQGKFKNGKSMSDFFEKFGLGNKGRERYKSGVSIITAQKFQVYSEIGFRMAVFKRSISNQLKAFGFKDISEVQDKRTLEDIYINAAASARNTTDFNQGGTVIKDFDSVIPYLNAATQSTRVMFDALNERPIETIGRMLQIAVITSPVPIGLSLLFFSLFKGDEDKDKSSSELYLEAYNGLSKYDRVNYYNIFNGKRNANGEFTYYRIAKAQQLTPLFTLVEGVIQNQMRDNIGNKESGVMIEDLKWGFSNNISPVDFGFGGFETFAKNPTLKSFISHSAGYDFFREQDISPDKGKVPVAAEGYGSKNVEDFYKIMGESLGLSPARLKASVESYITTPSTSPWIGVTYDTADFIVSDKDLKDRFLDFGGKTLKSFTGRVVKETSEYNRRIGNKEKIKDAVEEIEINRLKTKLNFNTLVADLKEGKITKKEINDEINELAKDKPFEAKRVAKRVKDQLINKDTPSFVFEVKYANTAKEKAVLLSDKFGDALLDYSKMQEKEKQIVRLLKQNNAINEEVWYEYRELVK